MTDKKVNYKEQMFDTLSTAIENIGKDDPSYTDHDKALDILDVLESLLAYSIFTTCVTSDNVRDSCEESYMNIKRRALRILEQEAKAK